MTAPLRGADVATQARTAARLSLTPLLWACLGALLIAALSQIPARHTVDIGGWDAAYVQGFHEPEPAGSPMLAGSSGTARWSRDSSALLFPQAGLPAQLSLRLRGPAEAPPAELLVLLNGRHELARLRLGSDWTTLNLPIEGGWLKASDFFIELRSSTTNLPDGRTVGVLLTKATYSVGPGFILPYPGQLLYGALVGVLLWTLLGSGPQQRSQVPDRGTKQAVARFLRTPLPYLLLYGLLWLLCYRLEPPLYPYPLRGLPLWTVGGLAALLALRDGPALVARRPWLLGTPAAGVVISGWTAATLRLADAHVTLARPGVENDFRVFATRETLAQVFSADGFYNLGYPLLLWLVRPLFAGNAFLAGRLLAVLAGATLLAGGYWLARSLLPRGPALLALLILALSGLVAQYGLYLGSDMPFAACMTLAVAALTATLRTSSGRRRVALAALAGLWGGLAFLMRHPGLLLLPWGLGALLLLGRVLSAQGRGAGGAGLEQSPGEPVMLSAAKHLTEPQERPFAALRVTTTRPQDRPFAALRVTTYDIAQAPAWAPALVYGLAFLLAITPQLAVNLAQTGQPLYSQQAKNIWLAVYGATDWSRWEEAPNTIGLAEVVLRDPARFIENWWRNIVAYLGSGAEDSSEFGRAMQLRLLGFPANWLAAGGLLAWLWLLLRRRITDGSALGLGALSALVALYVAAVSSAFTLQRFFLPLAPLYAVAAGWMLWRTFGSQRALAGAGLVLIVVLWGGYGVGAGYVLANQPPDEVAAVAMVRAIAPETLIAARVSPRLPLAKYSAIAHQVLDWPEGAMDGRPITPAELEAARTRGAGYLLWDEAAGPPPLADPAGARVTSSNRYGLYRLP
jgi:hypothetical protein